MHREIKHPRTRLLHRTIGAPSRTFCVRSIRTVAVDVREYFSQRWDILRFSDLIGVHFTTIFAKFPDGLISEVIRCVAASQTLELS